MSFSCNKRVYKRLLLCISVLIIDETSISTEFFSFIGALAEFLLSDHLLQSA